MFNPDIVVSVGVISFNQENYIRQCLDSILMQETDFRYEIVVGDDCSTDSTQDILTSYQNQYPDLFVLVLNKENKGISDNYKSVLSHCKGKYIAFCEGDDYWTDPHKLQLQVDFLERHEEYGFVGSYNLLQNPDGSFDKDPYEHLPEPHLEADWECYGNIFDFAKYGPVTRTVSLCFRKSIVDPYIQYPGTGNDLVLQTILAFHSSFAKYTKPLCVYRKGGVSTDRLSLEKQLYYNDWFVGNRFLQKKLFPNDCNWDENELGDRKKYLLLKHSIDTYKPFKALAYKKSLKSPAYKGKSFSKYLLGPVSCLLLSIGSKIMSTCNK